MADEDVTARLRLKDQRRFSRGLRSATGDVKGLRHETDRASKQAKLLNASTRQMGAGLRNVGRWAGYAGVALVGGAAYGAKKSYEAFNESRKVQKDQAAALKSTGAAAWINRRALEAQATSLSRLTGIDDELVAKSQTLGLTFRHVKNEAGAGNDIFNQMIGTSLDLSKRFDKDLGSSSVMLGKALENPVKGVTALTRVGVTFTAQQKTQIERLVEQNDLLGAQRIILGEVGKQTKGAAAAQATAADRFAVSWENVQEAIGAIEAPVIDEGLKEATKWADKLEPRLNKIAKRTEGIFDRDDLDLGQKLKRSGRFAGHELDPVFKDIKREFRKLHLGDELGGVIEDAAPKMANAMAAQVPHMASFFVKAFKEAGPGGQLLTAALITAKMGGFSAAGKWAAGTVASDFATTWTTSPTVKKKFRGVGRTTGKWVGRGLGAGILLGLVEYAPEIDAWVREHLHPVIDTIDFLGDQLGIRSDEAGRDALEDAGFDTQYPSQMPTGPRHPIGSPADMRHRGPRRRYRGAPEVREPSSRDRRGGVDRPSRRIGRQPFPGWELHGGLPIILEVDGRPLAETQAKVSVRMRERG